MDFITMLIFIIIIIWIYKKIKLKNNNNINITNQNISNDKKIETISYEAKSYLTTNEYVFYHKLVNISNEFIVIPHEQEYVTKRVLENINNN